jgi:glycine cleavage system aminomethyltransferase T
MAKNLQDVLDGAGNVIDFLRNQQAGPNVYPGVPAEYSNWRNEQRAWAKTAVLFNQSYHMVELMVEGPGAFAMLEALGINSFKNYKPGRAKQWVPCTPEGYVIGDVILFYLEENKFNLVGRAPAIEWAEYWASTGKWDVKVTRDERTALRTDGKRRHYRFQLQGPNAMAILSKALGYDAPDLKFFQMTEFPINGATVGALRHGMAGQPGYELYGPWADYEAVHSALVEAGKDLDLALVGGRAYSSNTLESGWVPSPFPGYLFGEGSADFRKWAGENSYGAKCSIGGSHIPASLEGYCLTPWDIGYGIMLKFDHEFIGKEALEKKAAGPHREKVTLALDDEDFLRVTSSYFAAEGRAKYFEFPSAVYSMHPYDAVLVDGKQVGVSTWVGYSSNEGKMLTLAIVEPEFAKPGTEVSLLWGEPNGGTKKPTVEPHEQTEIKAIVAPVPYSAVARTGYADSWRSKKA